MIRVLTFDGERGQKRFELAYQGFIAGGNQAGPNGQPVTPDRATIRQRAKILRQFKAIQAAFGAWENQCVRLEQPDFALLESYVERCPWSVQASDDVDDLFDFLSAAPKEE